MNKTIVSRGKFMAQNMELVCRLHQNKTGLKPKYIRVLTALIAHANYDTGGKAWPSRNRLAKMTGIRREVVYEILEDLRKWGYIWIKDERGNFLNEKNGPKKSYRLCRDKDTQEIDWPERCPDTPPPGSLGPTPGSLGPTPEPLGPTPEPHGTSYSRDNSGDYSRDETLETHTGLQANPLSPEKDSQTDRSPSQQTPEPESRVQCGAAVEIRSHPGMAGKRYMPEFIAFDSVSFPDGPDTILDLNDRLMVDAKYDKWLLQDSPTPAP